jgi:DNA modification methylase
LVAKSARPPEWPADRVERRAVADLVPYARNARTHSDFQVGEIAASIREWGWTVPVLVDEAGGIIAGHGRVLAARKLGIETVPVMVAAGWTEAQRRAYVLADNKLALNAGWDTDLLKVELADLQLQGFNLELTGFRAEELAGFLDSNEGLTDPDEVPEAPAEPVSRLGDVWLLGRHRLVCGDATSELDVSLALATVKPHLMVTDPPYGVEYDADWRNRAMRDDGSRIGGRAVGKVENDGRADWRDAWALFPGSVAYIWHAGTHAGDVAAGLKAMRFNIRAQIVWVKTRHVISRGDYHHQHEPAYYAVREGGDEGWHFVPEHEIASYAVKNGSPGQYVGGRKQSTVWFIEHVRSETGHSTQKPVECMRRPIENNSSPGQAVYEPFSGSGTTLIAAEMTGRACHALEISPAYVDVAVLRWQAFTGAEATLAGTGATYAATAAQRATVAA